jgi:hypothetical protein
MAQVEVRSQEVRIQESGVTIQDSGVRSHKSGAKLARVDVAVRAIPGRQLSPLFSITFPDHEAISFVFIDIPAYSVSFPQRSFVFIDIPALFL